MMLAAVPLGSDGLPESKIMKAVVWLVILGGVLACVGAISAAAQATVTPGAVELSKDAKAARFSPGLEDIVKLAKAKVDESVILTFIQNSPVAYNPTAQEIIELRELGISSQVISALIRRGDEVRQRAAETAKQSQAAASPPATQNQSSASVPSSVQPTVVYPVISPTVISTYPRYYYAPPYRHYYPSYYYPSYYSCYPRGYYGGFYPSISFGLHFGGAHFRGHHGFRHCR
jgi:hypothetical protein